MKWAHNLEGKNTLVTKEVIIVVLVGFLPLPVFPQDILGYTSRSEPNHKNGFLLLVLPQDGLGGEGERKERERERKKGSVRGTDSCKLIRRRTY
jgi:hypothetical protein